MSYQRGPECLRECEHGRHDSRTGQFVPFEVITTVTQDKHGFYCYDVGVLRGGDFIVIETVYEGVAPEDAPEGLELCRCCQHELVEVEDRP